MVVHLPQDDAGHSGAPRVGGWWAGRAEHLLGRWDAGSC